MTAPAAHPVLAACGFLDFTCQISQSITSWFASLVESAINPVLGIIGNDLLSTPQPGSFPAVTGMWGTSCPSPMPPTCCSSWPAGSC